MTFDIEKFIEQASKHYKKFGRDMIFEQAEEKIIKLKNPEYAFRFAKEVKGADINKLAQVAFDAKNAEFIYFFARICDGDIKPYQNAIIAIGDPKWATYFAKYVEGATTALLRSVVVGSKNAQYIRHFAVNVEEDKESRMPLEFSLLSLARDLYAKSAKSKVAANKLNEVIKQIVHYCNDVEFDNVNLLNQFIDVTLDADDVGAMIDFSIGISSMKYPTAALMEKSRMIEERMREHTIEYSGK